MPEGTCQMWGTGHGADGSGRGQSGQMRGPCWRGNSCTGASQSLACGRLCWNLLEFLWKKQIRKPPNTQNHNWGVLRFNVILIM